MSKPQTQQQRSLKEITRKATAFLQSCGYDLNHPDMQDTPSRLARIMQHYTQDGPPPELRTFPSDHTSMVTVVDHRAFTKCPHHLETVEMDISIGYLPKGRLLGISKLARLADYFSRGLMVQEELAELIASGLMDALKPHGVAVFIQGRHMCMRSRGVKSYSSETCTTVMKGIFKDNAKVGEEFFHTVQLVRLGRR